MSYQGMKLLRRLRDKVYDKEVHFMIAQKGAVDLASKETIRTLVVGGKPPILALVKRMLEDRTNCRIIGHWDSTENTTFGGRSFPRETELVFLVVDHMSTGQKEATLELCRRRDVAYVIGQRKFSTLSLPMETIGVKLRPSKGGRYPSIPEAIPMSKLEQKKYEGGRAAFLAGEKRKVPEKIKFPKTWLRGFDDAKREAREAEENLRQARAPQPPAPAPTEAPPIEPAAPVVPEIPTAPPAEEVVAPEAPVVPEVSVTTEDEIKALEAELDLEAKQEALLSELAGRMANRLRAMLMRGTTISNNVLIEVNLETYNVILSRKK